MRDQFVYGVFDEERKKRLLKKETISQELK